MFDAHADSRVSQTERLNQALLPSRPLLNMQTEKDVKEPNPAPESGVLCTETEHRICLFLLLYRQIHTKLCQNTRLGEYP